MATSALHLTRDSSPKPLIGFVVGRYFALTADARPDYIGITRNIEDAVTWTVRLWQAGFLVFTPHLNTHHFELSTRIDPDPLENEEYYRAFDRKLLTRGIDFIFAPPNWRQSNGGRLEVQLACALGLPVFESIAEVEAWANGDSLYSRVTYDTVSDAARHFGEGKDLKIALVDGPHWCQDGAEIDVQAIRRHAAAAEEAAVKLFNNKIAAFTPQLNASYERLGSTVPLDRYQALCDEILRRVADCHVLAPGWDNDPSTRARVAAANALGKPSFSSVNEAIAWRDGRTDYSAIRIG